jgi:hypothetical protein
MHLKGLRGLMWKPWRTVSCGCLAAAGPAAGEGLAATRGGLGGAGMLPFVAVIGHHP